MVAEHLSKRYATAARSPFAPASSILVSLRQRRTTADPIHAASEDYEELDDDDDLGDDELPVDSADWPNPSPGNGDGWALRDVSFTLPSGRATGLIGPTGSGKSTLLRMLAGLSLPTDGQAAIRGSVAPIPSIAASFMRPERSAAENVFGAARLFGVPRAVARRRVREILTFAGARAQDRPALREAGEQFRRLAMSATVGLDCAVVLLDELPRSSDEEFQARWLTRLLSLVDGGAAVLIASRRAATVQQICSELLWLDGGVLVDGPAAERAAGDDGPHANAATADPEPARVEHCESGIHRWAALLGAGACGHDGVPVDVIDAACESFVRIRVELAVRRIEVCWAITFTTADGRSVRVEQPERVTYPEVGVYIVIAEIPARLLGPGDYLARVEGAVSSKGREFVIGRTSFSLAVQDATSGDAPPGSSGATEQPPRPDRICLLLEGRHWSISREHEPSFGR